MIHTGNIQNKLEEAKDTLFMAEKYMDSLGKELEDYVARRFMEATGKKVRRANLEGFLFLIGYSAITICLSAMRTHSISQNGQDGWVT